MSGFEKPQQVFNIAGVEIGGQLGEVPCVLVGSIFHEGHRILRRGGEFDEEKARRLISVQEQMSKKTGVPCMLDVVAPTPAAMDSRLRFAAEHTECPILVNGPDARVRLLGISFARDHGILDRVVYDSINYRLDEKEMTGLRKTGVEAAIIQAFNPKNPMPNGMLEISSGPDGLIEKATRSGIKKPILFTPVLDLPSVGLAAAGLHLLKGTLGLPCGTAPVGVVGRSPSIAPLGDDAKKTSRAGAMALCQAMGADFIIYGTVARAKEVFPPCATVDAALAYRARCGGVRPRSSGPLSTLMRRRR